METRLIVDELSALGKLVPTVDIKSSQQRVNGIDDLHRVLTEDSVGKGANLTALRRDEKVHLEISPDQAPPARDG